MRVERVIDTPLCRLRLQAGDEGLLGVYFPDHPKAPAPAPEAPATHAVLDLAEAQLQAWLAGARRDLTVPLAPEGTEFQQRVWAGLQQIPFGETRTYSALTQAIGAPATAVRAVAAANGRNPLSIFIPCHRVIGQDGSLTGYAGGLPIKRWLLAHEGALLL